MSADPLREWESRNCEPVPEEWRWLGFSGFFTIEATLTHKGALGTTAMSRGELAEFEARLPDRVPFGTNSGWLALRVNHEVDPPTVVLVREDNAAIIGALTKPRSDSAGPETARAGVDR